MELLRTTLSRLKKRLDDTEAKFDQCDQEEYERFFALNYSIAHISGDIDTLNRALKILERENPHV